MFSYPFSFRLQYYYITQEYYSQSVVSGWRSGRAQPCDSHPSSVCCHHPPPGVCVGTLIGRGPVQSFGVRQLAAAFLPASLLAGVSVVPRSAASKLAEAKQVARTTASVVRATS